MICTINFLSQHPNEFWKINVPNGLRVVVLLWLQITLLLVELETMNVDLRLLVTSSQIADQLLFSWLEVEIVTTLVRSARGQWNRSLESSFCTVQVVPLEVVERGEFVQDARVGRPSFHGERHL
jgi:hypothetical protein